MAEGNRKDPRARVLNMTVRYKSATVDEFIENHSHDISRGGIFIKTRSPFPAGTLLKFEVRIAEDQKLMHGVGRVVWRREPERADENFPAGMGIKFIKLGEGAAELISQMVAAQHGAESSFDAGARESGDDSQVIPAATSATRVLETKTPTAPAPSEPFIQAVDSVPPKSLVGEAETTVSAPAKKRQDVAPETRKVVLQGPALEGPPSTPTATEADGDASGNEPATDRDRTWIASETTARRIRPRQPAPSRNLSGYALLAVVGAVGLAAVFANRERAATPAEAPHAEPPPVTAQARPATPAPQPAAAPEAEAAAEAASPAPATGTASGGEAASREATAAETPKPSVAAATAAKPSTPSSAAAPAAKPKARPTASRPTPVAASAPKPRRPKPLADAPRGSATQASPAPAAPPPRAKPPAAAAPAPAQPAPKKPTAKAAPPTPAAPSKPPAASAPAPRPSEPTAPKTAPAPTRSPSTKPSPAKPSAPAASDTPPSAAPAPSAPTRPAAPAPAEPPPARPPQPDDNPY